MKFDKTAWVKGQAALGELPDRNSLLAYLGLHDETRIVDKELLGKLKQDGASGFGGHGVGESTAELLGHDADRLAMAHILLYASKGHPAAYHRALVGAPNDTTFFETKTQERLALLVESGHAPDPVKAGDARDLDRGRKRTVGLDVKDIERQLGWSMTGLEPLVDMLCGEIENRKVEAAFHIDAAKLRIGLAPYEALYLQRGM